MPGDELEAVTEDLARKLAAGPTFAYRRIRRMAWLAAQSSFAEELAMEADLQRECVKSDDLREGLAAFRENRPPSFTGR